MTAGRAADAATLPAPLFRPGAHWHLLGICGYAVSGLALLARAEGRRVSGSDQDAYPPTTELLRREGIAVDGRHHPDNLVRHGPVDLLVVGNQVRRGNVEWAAARRAGLPEVSEAAAYLGLTADRRRVVVAGTHGKTTTASLLAHVLDRAGLDPGFRLGATARGFGVAARLGGRDGPFVFEGDEYTTTARDRRAKFLWWDPCVVGLLNLELDHPDVYPDLLHYRRPFARLVRGLPRDGRLVVNRDDPEARALAPAASCPVVTVGLREGDWRLAAEPTVARGLTRLRIRPPAGPDVEARVPLFGAAGATDTLVALAMAQAVGVAPPAAAAAARGYRGLARRLEWIGTARGVAVVDDYAHHPTEVAASLAGLRRRFGPRARLVCVYVPHTFSRTRALLGAYRDAFEEADRLLLGPVETARERHRAGSVSSADVAALVVGPRTAVVADSAEAVRTVVEEAQPGDVVCCASVRGFDGCAERILRALGGAGGDAVAPGHRPSNRPAQPHGRDQAPARRPVPR